jgi:arylsulfatase A-like enzyme
MIHRMDAGIGRVMKTLDETGLAKDTLVVFSSDNGATFEVGNQGTANYHDSNYPFRGQKRSLEEGGIRMPVVARWPGRIPAGRRCDDPLHMIDVMPSFVAAAGAGLDPAWKVDGLNMLDVWQGKAKAPDRTLFWEWEVQTWNMHAAMRGDFKLLDIGGNQFFYKIPDDPGERRTVAAEYPEVFKQLKAALAAWMATEVKR